MVYAKYRTYKRGFRSLFLGWTDGTTFIPTAFRHMSSADKKQRYNEARHTDNRTCGAKAKKQALMKAPDVALLMLRDIRKYGIPAKHVLFDSLFTHPKFVMGIYDIGYHSIGRLKNSKTLYSHDGYTYTLKELYGMHKIRAGK
ncbi:MAG: transposase [Oscillospiraceae bacterium]|nr:transposase [Oscillospiraceae bacterium]